MSDKRPIGVFDSGLGGLTAVRELKKLMPGEDIIYFGDTGRVPYGTRSAETIKKYAKQDEEFLISRGVKLVIAACGTVSAVAAETGRDLPVPFIEVVEPAVKAAIKVSNKKVIGVIGTSATINSGTYEKNIKSICPSAEVISRDCPILVPLVEAGWIDRDDIITIKTLQRYLEPMIDAKIDTLILGCTHYPVLGDIIFDILGASVSLINTGYEAAAAACSYLSQHNMLNNDGGKCRFYVSDRTESFSKTASILLGSDISAYVERVSIDHLIGENQRSI